MRRYLHLLTVFVTNSLQLEMEYRANFMLNTLNSLLLFGTGLVVLYTMFAHSVSVGGWTFDEALAVFGVFLITEAFIRGVLSPNLGRMPEYISTGNLDFVLLKPISSQFLTSFRYIDIWAFPGFLIGGGVVLYSMTEADTLTAWNLIAFLMMLATGAAIVYAIWLILYTTAFWFVRVDNLEEMFRTLLDTGRFPITAFPSWLGFILTFVLPIAFITNVPAAAATARLTLSAAVWSCAIAIVFLGASHIFWRFAVRSYTSASS